MSCGNRFVALRLSNDHFFVSSATQRSHNFSNQTTTFLAKIRFCELYRPRNPFSKIFWRRFESRHSWVAVRHVAACQRVASSKDVSKLLIFIMFNALGNFEIFGCDLPVTRKKKGLNDVSLAYELTSSTSSRRSPTSSEISTKDKKNSRLNLTAPPHFRSEIFQKIP